MLSVTVRTFTEVYDFLRRPYNWAQSMEVGVTAKFLVYYEACDEVLPTVVADIKMSFDIKEVTSQAAVVAKVTKKLEGMHRKYDNQSTCCVQHELVSIDSYKLID